MVESPLFIEEFHGASTLAFQFELIRIYIVQSANR
jgi:hypothetical protein